MINTSFKEDLDNVFGCVHCGEKLAEGDRYIHSKCHINSPLWAKYKDGALTLICSECEKEVLSVAVASEYDVTSFS